MKTWTLSKLLNQREYNQDEKVVLEYFFTNTDKNVYCAKDTLPSQVWAFLLWQYSRSHLSLRDRFLQIFNDQKKAFEEWKIWNNEYISLVELAETIKQKNDIKLQYFYDRATSFLRKWWVEYGHNSIKDWDTIRFAAEWVSQVFTKIIESPFPALWAFQETSTRYMPFSKENILFPPEIEKSSFKEEIKKSVYELFEVYEKWLIIVKEALIKNSIFKREDFTSENAFNSTLNTKTFDICRYLLPSGTATKLWCSFQTRTLESHISFMLSHPLEEARIIWKSIWEEAKKISPGLLNHVAENNFDIERYSDLSNWADNYFKNKEIHTPIYKWTSEDDRLNIVNIWNLDDNILASILFESARKYWLSFSECLENVEKMSKVEKENLMETALWKRWKFDRMPRALQHTSVFAEFLLDFWAYRDLQRHRATKQIWQWVTAIHWYSYPEYISLPGMEEFKKMYDNIMMKLVELWRKIIKENIYLAEYTAALWHLVRTTYEMDPGQIAYLIELRTTPQAHHSYRDIIFRLYEKIQEKAPIFAKYIRVWSGNTSRKDEVERIEAKKRALWING